MPSVVCRLVDVEVRYGDRVALSVPELKVAAGEVLALVGPNGAGKSTLLQIAALLRWPERGEVWIGGERAARRTAGALRRRIAMVFQAPLLFDVGVLGNVTSGLRFRGVGRREAERRAVAWLERFGVAHLAGRGVRGLSGGEAQRVSLARAFAVEPELLLLDEPFAALDAPTRASLVPELGRQLREAGTTAVVVTHDLSEALTLGDRLGVMLAGRIAQLGPPETVVARPATAEVAALLGVENVLPARVTALAGTTAVVRLESGGGTVVVRVPSDLMLVLDQVVALIVHPADVTIRRPGVAMDDGWNALAGVTVTVSPTLSGERVVLDCGALFVATVPRSSDPLRFAPGEMVVVGFPPEAAHLTAIAKE